MTRIAVIFDNFGPYHQARLSALAGIADLVAIQLRARSREYAWNTLETGTFRRRTLLSPGDDEGFLVPRLRAALTEARPQAVFVPGWASPGALAALAWCGSNGVPALLMSDSQEADFARRAVGEWVKRRLLDHVAGALVGGTPHAAYAAALGIDPERILPGYDVVDNAYFQRRAAEVRAAEAEIRQQIGLPRPFLLASARFIEKKNLPGLLEAFAASGCVDSDVDLVLLGDGPLREQIEARVTALGLEGSVHLPGFVQYPDLPRYYGLAQGFVHASTTEQWGLVVNEAMASGVPVIVSQACGCAADLVRPGVNGHVFAPTDTETLSRHMRTLANLDPEQRRAMGQAAQDTIARWSPETFAQNAVRLAELALGDRPRPLGTLSRAVNALVARVKAGA